MLGGVVRSEILSKDMVIISAYELERNEENVRVKLLRSFSQETISCRDIKEPTDLRRR